MRRALTSSLAIIQEGVSLPVERRARQQRVSYRLQCSQRTCAQCASSSREAAVVSSSPSPPRSSPPPPLPVMPSFSPQPFVQDKFLSIRNRSAETFIENRREILARSAKLREKIAALSVNVNRDTAEAFPLLDGPLPAALAEELLHLQTKLDKLEETQGFVLTDELVFRAFHESMAAGAHREAMLRWLLPRILGERRGPVFPMLVLEDLATVATFALLRDTPASEAALTMLSQVPPPPALPVAPSAVWHSQHAPPSAQSLLTALSASQAAVRRQRQRLWAAALLTGEAVGVMDTIPATTTTADAGEVHEASTFAAKRAFMEDVLMDFPSSSSTSRAGSGEAGISTTAMLTASRHSRIVRRQLEEHWAPLLAALDSLGVLFTEAPPLALDEETAGLGKDVEDTVGEGETNELGDTCENSATHTLWIPSAEMQREAIGQLLTRFTNQHSFLRGENANVDQDGRFTSGAAAASSPHREASVSLSSFQLNSDTAPTAAVDAGTQHVWNATDTAKEQMREGLPAEVKDPLAVLSHVTSLYTALATCAAELRAETLLLALLASFVRGFVCVAASTPLSRGKDAWAPGDEGVAVTQYTLNTEVWLAALSDATSSTPGLDANQRAEVVTRLRGFASEFLSTIFYGRQALSSDRAVWQAHDVLQVVEALRVVLHGVDEGEQGMPQGTNAAATAASPTISLGKEMERMRQREQVLASVHALVSGTHGDAPAETATAQMLLDDLPKLLKRLLTDMSYPHINGPPAAQRAASVTSLLWADAAHIADAVLRYLQSESQEAASQCDAARLYVAVASADTETIRALHAHARGSGAAEGADEPQGQQLSLSPSEWQAILLSTSAEAQVNEEKHRLSALLRSDACDPSASATHPVEGDNRGMMEEAVALMRDAARTSGKPHANHLQDMLMDTVAIASLHQALALLRQCYEAALPSSLTGPRSTSGSRPSTAHTHGNDADVDEGSDGALDDADDHYQEAVGEAAHDNTAAEVEADRDAFLDSEEDVDAQNGREESEERTVHATEDDTTRAWEMDTEAFTAAFRANACGVLSRVQEQLQEFVMLSAASEASSATVDLTPGTAARAALLASALMDRVGDCPANSPESPHTRALYEHLINAFPQPFPMDAPDATLALQEGASTTEVETSQAPFAGNAVGVLLLALGRTDQWSLVERVLAQTLGLQAPTSAQASLTRLNAVTVEPEVFAELFQRARDAGATEVCLMLSSHRSSLFF